MTERQKETAAWLNRAYILTKKIEALREEKRSLECDIHGIGDNIGAGRSDARVNSIENRRTRLLVLSHQIDCKTDALDKERLKIKQAIESVPDKHYAILSYRYLSFLSWGAIESRLYISESTRKRQHRAALDAVAQKLNLFDPLGKAYNDIIEKQSKKQK